ncbi:glycosyltransferase [Pedobacter gandavensis]|uniref:glycosyltransferase family 2 protein n=1 Tax=Pedobacter gandavensis TaxID=2679963 RepID=UPI0024787D2D|nr:glycosyltransferase [Pedobacter gandavensis]WGQ08894.1 glycosyltransferase [Pedobacter gandavensis]
MNHIHDTIDFKDFDISVVMSFYKKMKDFRRVLPVNAPYFQRNGIEVIIALDEPTECEELLEFIKKYPGINWRVIVNRDDHDWRNPCKAWNVGIRHATKKYILVVDPECEFLTDVIYHLKYAAETYDNYFYVGQVAFVDYNYTPNTEALETTNFSTYGSFLAKKEHIEQVDGYTEAFSIWGGEDDNLRAKLEMKGIKKARVASALILHREDEPNGEALRADKSLALPLELNHKAFIPDEQDFINPNWGRDFSEVCYDYLNKNQNG